MSTDNISAMAIEFWKLIRSYERILIFLPPEHHAKTQAQVRFSARRLAAVLEESGIRLVTFDGQVFEPNLPVTAVNMEDFGNTDENLIIEQTIEPTVMNDNSIVSMGKVVLTVGGKYVPGN